MTKQEAIIDIENKIRNTEAAISFVSGGLRWTESFKGRIQALEVAVDIIKNIEG